MRIRFMGACLLFCMAGCNGPAPYKAGGEPNATADNPAGAGATQPATSFDRETAETLTAMHFSELNRQAKYQRYKGLLIDIDTIFPAGPDGSNRFRVLVQGRLWDTPTADTITRPYRDTINFIAAREGNRWQARVSE